MYLPVVDADKCVACGECASACPGSVLVVNECAEVSEDNECMGCQSCVLICPAGAITLTEF